MTLAEHLPTIAFIGTAAAVFRVQLKSAIPFHLAFERLEQLMARQGQTAYWLAIPWGMRFFKNEECIFADTDTPEIREAKQEVVRRNRECHASIKPAVCTACVGMSIVVLSSFVAMALR